MERCQSEESVDRIRRKDADRQAIRRVNESTEQSEARRRTISHCNRSAREHQRQADRDEAIHFDEQQLDQHSCGPLHIVCQFCGSKNFLAERPSDGKFTNCCRKGKLKLPKPIDVNDVELTYPAFCRDGCQTHKIQIR